MKFKTSLKQILIILGAVGILLSAILILFLAFTLPGRGYYAKSLSPVSSNILQNLKQASSGLPVSLIIPKINIDATVEQVGLTPQGAMGVPKGPADVAWFDLGPRPGEKGSAVIAGHEGWKDGIPAVFDNLYKLQKGDKIYIQDDQGATTAFVVREIVIYDQNGDASGIFSSSDGQAHLNLITCEGTWNAAQKSYSNRLVVFTDKETE